MLKFQARLAGADVKDQPSRRKMSDSEDAYGKMLEFRQKLKRESVEFADISACTKPL